MNYVVLYETDEEDEDDCVCLAEGFFFVEGDILDLDSAMQCTLHTFFILWSDERVKVEKQVKEPKK